MKLNTLTERQRLILLHALKSTKMDQTSRFIIDPNATAEDVREDTDYLISQLRNG